jgi:hypothetical protein
MGVFSDRTSVERILYAVLMYENINQGVYLRFSKIIHPPLSRVNSPRGGAASSSIYHSHILMFNSFQLTLFALHIFFL